jgi:hypothetical protein
MQTAALHGSSTTVNMGGPMSGGRSEVSALPREPCVGTVVEDSGLWSFI